MSAPIAMDVPAGEQQRVTFWRRFRANRGAVVGAVLVLGVCALAIFAPAIAPYPPEADFPDGLSKLGAPLAPGAKFLLGTDQLGRDVLSRLIYASRISLQVGFIATAVNIVVGTLLGMIAGYWGGWVDTLVMRLTDVMLAFPFLLFVILLVSLLRPGVAVMYMVIGLLGWANTARIARGQTLSVVRNAYVEAARTLGAGSLRIMGVHVLLNIFPPVLAFGTLRVGAYVLLEGALSYMGAGVPPPTPSWGNMIFTGQQYFQVAPWLVVYPGLLLIITVLGFNLLGDGLNDVLNPRQH